MSLGSSFDKENYQVKTTGALFGSSAEMVDVGHTKTVSQNCTNVRVRVDFLKLPSFNNHCQIGQTSFFCPLQFYITEP